jgi:A/G-specific adenine glycosylase
VSGIARVDRTRAARFSLALRRWFRSNGRALPWRETRDPYRVLVSEAMLQQTQVSRVLDYYQRFLRRFPTLNHVARARPGQVRESWDGLGYYARARNLHALARRTSEIPADVDALRALPGIGRYTAGAIACFAYERREALVDTNVARVLRRVFAPRADFKTSRGQQRLWAIAERILPRTGRQAWEHNQGLMELGALVCTARVARCHVCPVAATCASANRRTGDRPRSGPGTGRDRD